MEQLVKIRKILPDGAAEVVRIRESACSGDCHKCSGCGAAQETMVFRAENPINAQAGELVTIRSETAPVLMAAAVLYLMPLVLFFAGYFLGEVIWQQGALPGCGGFLLGLCLSILYDRKIARKQKTTYIITGRSGGIPPESHRERDNDLD